MRKIKGRFATPAPRKRRDAAPRSRYWMRPWPQNAALAARISADMPRGSALNGRICWKFATLPLSRSDFDLRHAARHRRPRARLPWRRSNDDAAQMNPRRARRSRARRAIRSACGSKDNWRPSTAAPAPATPPRTNRSAAIRKRRPSSRANSIASRSRPSGWAAKARASSRCSTAELGAMRSGQQPDPADARQSRPDHHQPGAPAQRRHRRRRPRKPAPLGADGARAEQLRPAICRCRARPRQLHRQSVRQQPDAAAAERRSRRAVRHLPHRLRPHLRRRVFPGLVRHRARRVSRTTRGPARRCARRRRRPCSPTATPAKTSTRRSRSAARTIPRCPNAFKFRTEFNPSCACKAAGQTWSEALKSVDDKAAVEQQGDIIVTEESAKRMQQRAQPKGAPPPSTAKKGAAPAGTAAAPPHSAPAETTARRRTRTRSAPSARPSSRRSNKRA